MLQAGWTGGTMGVGRGPWLPHGFSYVVQYISITKYLRST